MLPSVIDVKVDSEYNATAEAEGICGNEQLSTEQVTPPSEQLEPKFEEPKVVTPQEPTVDVTPETEVIDVVTEKGNVTMSEPCPVLVERETDMQDRPSTIESSGPVLDMLVIEQAAHSTELISPLLISDEGVQDIDDDEFASLVADNEAMTSPVQPSSPKIITPDSELLVRVKSEEVQAFTNEQNSWEHLFL